MDAVAIIGMASIFPGAPDLTTYWSNLRGGVDAITDVPPTRWDPAYFDPAAKAIDRLYCKRGGFIDAFARFDPTAHGVMPIAAGGAEPDQLLTLELATRALADAGYADRPFAREKAGVILGRGNYAGAARTRLEQHVRGAEQLVQALRTLIPSLDAAQLAAVRAEFQAALGQGGADSAIGLVPNLTASRITNRLDLAGPAFTIDAACASSLVAVDQACAELDSGRCDLVIAGGVHLSHDEAFWSVFCQLGALSRSQQIWPFDRRADGLLIGEGIGLVVLKRRIDAERDNDRIYAIIRGTGVASDGASSLMSPRVEGQLLALERAWQAAGIDRDTVEMVEAHGTGTPAGDAAELETLRRFFGTSDEGARAVLGSVKSMIGHTMPAAGAASLIKAALALHHAELPPTLHCEEPHPALAKTRFRTVSMVEPWDRGSGREGVPRRAAVSAFGFGGINAHLVLEETRSRRARRRAVAAAPVSLEARLCCLAARSPRELLGMLDRRTADSAGEKPTLERDGSGSCRLAILDPTAPRLALARSIVERGRRWPGRNAIWFAPQALLSDGGRLAFMFPGLDSSFRPRVDDVAAHFGLPLPPLLALEELEDIGLAIVRVDLLLHRALDACGVRPDWLLGHSIGEWSAMVAAGMIEPAAVESFIASIEGRSLVVPNVAFAAAGCGTERAAAALSGLPSIAVSHDNCPHQVILCGADASIDIALQRLAAERVLCQRLPFRSGFHSPLFAPFLAPHRENFARVPIRPARLPLFSATTCAEYPRDPDEIRALALRHLIEPIRFRELVVALYERGARVFVQVGTGSLPGFVEDTLHGRPHLAITANHPSHSGLEQLRRLVAALFADGAEPAFDRLFSGAGHEVAQNGATPPREAAMQLALGVPLVRLKTPLALTTAIPSAAPADRVAVAFRGVLDEIARAQSEVLAGFEKHATSSAQTAAGAPGPAPCESHSVRTLSLETYPELLDHTFFRQPPDWPVLSDRHPVVPMTASIQIMIEAAAALVPGLRVVGVDEVQAVSWLVVSKPVAAKIHARYDGRDRVAVSIEGYAKATIRLATDYPPPPAPLPALGEADGVQPAPVSAARLYADRWMFHGPAYQGLVELGPIGDRAIAGVIETGAAKGALLDNAGQLFGYWVMVESTKDRMAMPVKIERIRFYAPHPAPGERLACTVRIRKQGEREVIADLSLHAPSTGRVWATIEGWEDRRFESDERLFSVLQFPERNLLSVPRPEGWVIFNDHYRGATTRDHMARRFLGERERAVYEKQGPRNQRGWLSGRIAAKDAVRHHLWQRGDGPLFPVEIEISNDASGRPLASSAARHDLDLRISIAHKGETAVAYVAEGRDVGIDIESIEQRSPGFVELAFHPEDLALLGDSDDRDEWLTRLWAAKEAVGKLRGTGLGADPRRLRFSDRQSERLLADGVWVETRREADHIIAWSIP